MGGGGANGTNIRINFVHRHLQYMLVILEEGNCPHPQCLDCDMFPSWEDLNRSHLINELCACVAEIIHRILEDQESMEM